MLGRMRRSRELRSRLFGQMLERFGITRRNDFAFSDGGALYTAAARCIHCPAVDRCKSWMETTAGTEGTAEFCPNASTFAAIGRRDRV